MFGLWFSIIGLAFGTLCSIKAKDKNRTKNDWFILGFLFSFIASIMLVVLPPLDNYKNYIDRTNLDESLLNNDLAEKLNNSLTLP